MIGCTIMKVKELQRENAENWLWSQEHASLKCYLNYMQLAARVQNVRAFTWSNGINITLMLQTNMKTMKQDLQKVKYFRQ